MAEQDSQYLIELDGNQEPDELLAVSKLCTNFNQFPLEINFSVLWIACFLKMLTNF